MTITPPRFRRSSESSEADRQAVSEMDRLGKIDAEAQMREDELESLACGVTSSSRRSLTDESRLDLEGVVRP